MVTPLHCRCTGANCESDVMDTCYTIHSCFTKTIGGNTSYGCMQSLGLEQFYCSKMFKTLQCCTTDLCNNNGLPPKPYLSVPSTKLASLVKRIVTVNITDSVDRRAKIDGYVATMYTPGENRQKIQILASDTRSFTFSYLLVNTTYVIEVTSYRGRVASERSKAITIKTKSPECDYFKMGEIGGKKTESCTSFGCVSTWTKYGTILTLVERGCWNDVSESKCQTLQKQYMNNSIEFVICTCDRRSCTPKTKT
ncbi:---NA--- [Paramuricea clavata]|nr:---NA--- [Paramuricea clavata]